MISIFSLVLIPPKIDGVGEEGRWLIIIIIIIYLFKLQMGFYPVTVYYNKTQHTTHTTYPLPVTGDRRPSILTGFFCGFCQIPEANVWIEPLPPSLPF
jgi:hypothetical protein